MSSSGSVDGIKRNLLRKTEDLNKSNERLASGKRINKASDDAAGLGIALALAADTVQLTQASRNISDGGSLAAIREGVYSSLSNISTRQAELATQASNGTLSDAQRASLNQEFQALSEEANRIVASTTFNGQQVADSSVTIQAGTGSDANSQIQLVSPALGETVAALLPLDISSQDSARSALTQVQSFLENVSQSQGQLGAESSRLEVANNNVLSRREATQAAESRIRDVDYAEEVSRRVAADIGQQTTTALFAQAQKLNAFTVQRLLA